MTRLSPGTTLRLATTARSTSAKFVIVTVATVRNPRKVPLLFLVDFRPASGPVVPLGNFSLYPADRPGRFIVPTQHKLEAGGAVMLRIEHEGGVDPKGVEVGIGGFDLGDG